MHGASLPHALQPPHPAPHAPMRLEVPAKACDAHCHIFGPIARFPYRPDRSYEPVETPLERYQEMAAILGLERAVFVQPAVYGTDHSAMIDALERGRGRYAGVGIVDDSVTEATLARMHDAGIRGARFNHVGHLGAQPSRDDILRVAGRVAPLGWHLVFHVDGSALMREAEFLDRLPCDFVIDHMARLDAYAGIDQPAFAALLSLAIRPNCWIKISAADRMTCADGLAGAVPYMRALVAAAPDRTLWGTDWPHPNSVWIPDDGDLIDLLADAVPDAAQRDAILVANPTRLYAFT